MKGLRNSALLIRSIPIRTLLSRMISELNS